MEMSSSSDSQWSPRVVRRTCARCSGVACNKRGNHASGTPTTRPSLRSTHMLSESKRTPVGLATEKVIPCSFYARSVGLHDLQQFAERSSIITVIVSDPNIRTQPELRFNACLFYVDMNGFARSSFVGIKEEPETAFEEDRWHFVVPTRSKASRYYAAVDLKFGKKTWVVERSPMGRRVTVRTVMSSSWPKAMACCEASPAVGFLAKRVCRRSKP